MCGRAICSSTVRQHGEPEVNAAEIMSQPVITVREDTTLEELARTFVRTETEHMDEVKKMLRSA